MLQQLAIKQSQRGRQKRLICVLNLGRDGSTKTKKNLRSDGEESSHSRQQTNHPYLISVVLMHSATLTNK